MILLVKCGSWNVYDKVYNRNSSMCFDRHTGPIFIYLKCHSGFCGVDLVPLWEMEVKQGLLTISTGLCVCVYICVCWGAWQPLFPLVSLRHKSLYGLFDFLMRKCCAITQFWKEKALRSLRGRLAICKSYL